VDAKIATAVVMIWGGGWGAARSMVDVTTVTRTVILCARIVTDLARICAISAIMHDRIGAAVVLHAALVQRSCPVATTLFAGTARAVGVRVVVLVVA